MSEKYTEGVKFMNALAEASFLVRKIAEPSPAGESVKAAILRASRRLGSWTHNRVRDVWYGDHRISVSGDELNHLRAVARQQMETSRDADLEEIRNWMAATEERLSRIDRDFHVPTIESIRDATPATGEPTSGGGGGPVRVDFGGDE